MRPWRGRSGQEITWGPVAGGGVGPAAGAGSRRAISRWMRGPSAAWGCGRAVRCNWRKRCLGQWPAVQGATRLIDVTRGHIDGCILAHDANLNLCRGGMAEMGAKVVIPDHDQRDFGGPARAGATGGVPPVFGTRRAVGRCLCADGGRCPTFTCAPYQGVSVPAAPPFFFFFFFFFFLFFFPSFFFSLFFAGAWRGDRLVGIERGDLCQFGSGARTAKHPDYLDLSSRMTGRGAGERGCISTPTGWRGGDRGGRARGGRMMRSGRCWGGWRGGWRRTGCPVLLGA